jgi:hypothetical protein
MKDCTNCALIDTGKCPLDRQRKQSSLLVCDKWVGELKREIVFWHVEDHQQLTRMSSTSRHQPECLQHDDIDDAIEDYLEWSGDISNTIEVVGYARVVPTNDGQRSLWTLLEDLDEELGSKDDVITPTPRMIEAAAAFAKVVCSEYVSWQCEEVTRQTVDVGEWICKHHPEWLEAREADVMERLATTFGPRK